jgi:hypothetical protein
MGSLTDGTKKEEEECNFGVNGVVSLDPFTKEDGVGVMDSSVDAEHSAMSSIVVVVNLLR